jgi:hypothetical protein
MEEKKKQAQWEGEETEGRADRHIEEQTQKNELERKGKRERGGERVKGKAAIMRDS